MHRAKLDSLLSRGRANAQPRLNEQALRNFFSGRIRNPFQLILRIADSVRLTDAQADALSNLNMEFAGAADRLWTPVAVTLARLPDRYDLDSAWSNVNSVAGQVMAVVIAGAYQANALLTDEQFARIPSASRRWLIPGCIRSVFPTAVTRLPSYYGPARIENLTTLPNAQRLLDDSDCR